MEIPSVPSTALAAELSELIGAVEPTSFVNVLLQRGFSHRGTDLHLDPIAGGLRARFRVDGALQDIVRIPGAYGTHVISRIKVLCGMDITDKRLPQDGQIVASQVTGIPRDVRVSSIPTILGERLVLRLMPPSDQFVTPETLGLSPEQLRTVYRFLAAPYGLLLVVGPVGAGKTTTVYSLLSKLNQPDRSVVTIEDPVERRIPGASQIQVDTKTGLLFATALRGVLRQDPNVISIGEIRDAETAQIACRAATTGVLVISTLHANNTASAIDVLRNFGISAMTIADCLVGVIAQRLVRLVSDDSKELYTAAESECGLLNCSPAEPPQLARGLVTDQNLNTGYFGRTAVIETLEISPTIRNVICNEQPAYVIREIAEKEGMTSLQDSARQLVLAGRTTVSEYSRLVQDVRWKDDAKKGSSTNSVREYEMDETTSMVCDGGDSCDSP
jgi:type II secretory ATPase GspE/PulE/Tfp pilus assembly ATPase PilB-like protein